MSKKSLKFIIREVFEELIDEDLTQNKQGNFDVLYRDVNVTVLVPKTFESCVITTRNTEWCSKTWGGYSEHKFGKKEVFFRFLFKDGYKLRLSWSMDNKNDFHWGGIIKSKDWNYPYLTSNNEYFLNDPFHFNYNILKEFDYDSKRKLSDDQKIILQYINLIPNEARNMIFRYYEESAHNFKLNGFEGNFEYEQVKKEKEDNEKKWADIGLRFNERNKQRELEAIKNKELARQIRKEKRNKNKTPQPSVYDPSKKQYYIGGQYYDL